MVRSLCLCRPLRSAPARKPYLRRWLILHTPGDFFYRAYNNFYIRVSDVPCVPRACAALTFSPASAGCVCRPCRAFPAVALAYVSVSLNCNTVFSSNCLPRGLDREVQAFAFDVAMNSLVRMHSAILHTVTLLVSCRRFIIYDILRTPSATIVFL